ncbi:MAG: TylF/MycF family methyltransferase [Methanosarcinales archaeon Met12]|nr:MAG: TylF/MycF family methyltransferase [Methanosarcinales archaeon Met12]
MITKPEILYIDLLKKALTFTLWDEPPYPITNYTRIFTLKSILIAIVSKILATKRLQIVQNREVSENERIEGMIWPGYAHTMIGTKRLDNLQFCIETVIKNGVEGDLIETGVWRGGACIFMRGVLAAYKIEDRRVFVADSFEGLPKPDAVKCPSDKGDSHYKFQFLSVSKEEVEKNFEKYGLLDKQVVFLKGWFKDTLPTAPIEKLSILRLDGDMYESTMDALNNLYPKLSQGGFCIIDDYGCLKNCKEAVDDYRAKNQINDEIKVIDWTGIYWVKS